MELSKKKLSVKQIIAIVSAVAVLVVVGLVFYFTSGSNKYIAKMENANDTLSYALGVHYAQGYSTELMQQTYGIDVSYIPHVVEGMIAVDQEDDAEKLASYVGTSLAINLELMLQNANRTLLGKDAKCEINVAKFFEIFYVAANGSDAGMVVSKAEQFLTSLNDRIQVNAPAITSETCDSIAVALAVSTAANFDQFITDGYRVDLSYKGTILEAMKTTANTIAAEEKAFQVGVTMGIRFAYEILPGLQSEFFDAPDNFNKDNFYAAFFATIQKDESLLLDNIQSATIVNQAYKKKIEAKQQAYQAEIDALFAENKAAGIAFLEENKKQEGVHVTASGLQYQVLKEGKGAKPVATDIVKVHYHGTLVDGTVFDSSVSRGEPLDILLSSVIPGWTEGVQLMNVGAKYRFVIPYELAYGIYGSASIQPYSALIFEVELLDIVK